MKDKFYDEYDPIVESSIVASFLVVVYSAFIIFVILNVMRGFIAGVQTEPTVNERITFVRTYTTLEKPKILKKASYKFFAAQKLYCLPAEKFYLIKRIKTIYLGRQNFSHKSLKYNYNKVNRLSKKHAFSNKVFRKESGNISFLS